MNEMPVFHIDDVKLRRAGLGTANAKLLFSGGSIAN